MAQFHHPHLTRGIVHTPGGSFTIVRGIVDLPDDIGELYGWHRVDDEEDARPQTALRAEISRSGSGDRVFVTK